MTGTTDHSSNVNKQPVKSRLDIATAWAGIVAVLLALIFLLFQILKPEVNVITVVQKQVPYQALFLFLFSLVAITYFLISKLLVRIGDVYISSDVVTTNHIGDYIRGNIK